MRWILPFTLLIGCGGAQPSPIASIPSLAGGGDLPSPFLATVKIATPDGIIVHKDWHFDWERFAGEDCSPTLQLVSPASSFRITLPFPVIQGAGAHLAAFGEDIAFGSQRVPPGYEDDEGTTWALYGGTVEVVRLTATHLDLAFDGTERCRVPALAPLVDMVQWESVSTDCSTVSTMNVTFEVESPSLVVDMQGILANEDLECLWTEQGYATDLEGEPLCERGALVGDCADFAAE